MSDNPSAVMLFAAGFGTRMKELTANQPKPLVKVAGKPLIDHALELTNITPPVRRVVNLHYRAEMLEKYLRDSDVVTVNEQPDILETGGGLRHALPQLGNGPVFTLNTDAVWKGPNPLEILRKAWQPKKMDALVILIDPTRAIGTTSEGDFSLSNEGHISRGPGFVYGGVQIMRTEGLHDIEDKVFSLNVLWDQMIEARRMFGVVYPGYWCDVGHPAGIKLAEDMLESQNV